MRCQRRAALPPRGGARAGHFVSACAASGRRSAYRAETVLRWASLLAVVAASLAAVRLVDCNEYAMRPDPVLDASPASPDGRFAWEVPLDPASPWPKFRADPRQTGRSPLRATRSDAEPWVFETGKGVFSSPVIDAEGTAYVGSADHAFYAIRADGSLAWRFPTGEIIDSSALLDDRGRVYVPSGDAHLYALDRSTGREVWRFRAHTPAEVERLHGVEVFNVDWWEGNVAILPDGTLLAGNDNYLYYRIDRDTGRELDHWLGNELGWSLPAVNVRTGRVFFGTMFVALRNLFAYEWASGERIWGSGALGPIVASPLVTSSRADGAVVVAGFDGWVRAFAQESGRQLWRFATRDHVYASPAQLSDGRLVAASTDGSVYALEPEDGRVVWTFDGLAPIRSSPAVDAEDRIYFGSGDGRLVVLNADGTRRWSWRCIDGDRDDLNGSPALGPYGIHVGGEDGSVCFVPWDWCLSPAGRADPRCSAGGGEALPDEGARLLWTSRFGALATEAPREIDANEPLAFTLSVRERGDTVAASIDTRSLTVVVSSGVARVDASADGRFLTVVPESPWAGPEGGRLAVEVRAAYRVRPWRIGLKALGGRRGGEVEERFEIEVRPRAAAPMPYAVGTSFEIARLAAPNPTMLPSWNQIGFDSIRYLGGVVEASGDRAVVWFAGGRHDAATDRAVLDPASATRFPLVLTWDDGLLTLREPGPFELDFNGSWAMPYRRWRLATRAEAGGRIEPSPALHAVADCDRIPNYGPFLKLLGLSGWDSGLMTVYGAAQLSLREAVEAPSPDEVGSVAIEVGATEAVARFAGGRVRAGERALGLLVVDAATGAPVPLAYAQDTSIESDADGAVTAVRLRYDEGSLPESVRVYAMVDLAPAATAVVRAPVR